MPLSRHTPFYIAALAVIGGLATSAWLGWQMAILIATNGFFATYLVLTLPGMARLDKASLSRQVATSDAPARLIFAITLLTVCAAMASLFLVVNAQSAARFTVFVLALVSVPLGWATIHVMAAIHYAHLFWRPEQGGDRPRKGLEFPGTKEPAGTDFLYFSFVIGMTAQTSDVAITGSHLRGFNLMHAITSFFFNTVLVAAAVNVAVSLGN
ncbi:MAG: DUF1345 domain-containing protein [Mesorhizobium sp.]